MMRATLAVVGGYLTMFVGVFVTFTIAYLVLGTEGSFQEGSYEPSTTWIAISFVLGFLASVLGGLVCAGIAGRHGPVVGLVVVLLILGGLQAVFVMGMEAPGPRPADVSSFDAMMKAVTPVWVAFANPVIGAVGVLLGGRRAKRAA